MLQEHINILTIKPLILLLSTATKKPYIDQENSCYMFETKSDIVAFSEGVDNTFFGEAEYHKQIVFCTGFYSYGIEKIKVKLREKKDFLVIPVEKEDAKRQFYNALANRMILRLKQTGQPKYLRGLAKHTFYTPVLVDPRRSCQCPNVHFSYLAFNGEGKYFLLFSTLQEFDKWNKTQESKWHPLETSFKEVGKIRKINPVIINPIEDKLILTDKNIKQMLSEGKNENKSFI